MNRNQMDMEKLYDLSIKHLESYSSIFSKKNGTGGRSSKVDSNTPPAQ